MIRFTNIGTDSDRYGFDGHGRMSRVAGTDRRWGSGSSTMSSSTMSRSISDKMDATIYGYRYCRDDRQRRAAENMTKYSYDIAEIVEILNEFKVDMKLPGGSPRPLVSILLDIVRMYTQIHDPATGSRLLTLSESINQIITRCVENGMNQREITSEILCDPEVDDAQLDDFLHEFAIKEG